MRSTSKNGVKSSKNGAKPDIPQKKRREQSQQQQTIRVLLVDDQKFARQRLKAMLEPQGDLEVVGMADNGSTAIEQAKSLKANVVLMDLEMPDMNGIEATQAIASNSASCKVIVLSIHEGEEYVNDALRIGAKGYITKSASAEELATAVRSVHGGSAYLGPGLLEKLNFTEPKSDEDSSTTTDSEANADSAEPESESEPGIFREKSLERLSSPDRLDQLMQVVAPKSWLPIATLGSLLFAGIIWSVLGRIPVTVEGRGVVIYPSKVVPLQSKTQGQITTLNLEVGDLIQKGDAIATIDISDLEKQLTLAQDKLDRLQGQDRSASSLQSERGKREETASGEQREALNQRLTILQDLTPILREKGLVSIRSERVTLESRLQKLQELTPIFDERLKTRQMLFEEGAISDDNLLQARQEYIDNTAQIDDAESQLAQLDVKESEAEQQYLNNLNEIEDIQAQKQELDREQATFAQEDFQTSTTRNEKIQETEQEIAKLQQQIGQDGKIISQHTGRVLEVATNLGDVLNAGARIANINVEGSDKGLVGVTYFPIKDGKKVRSQMKIQITPQVVKRERYGGIIGDVTKVSPFPVTKEAAAKVIGNPDIVEGLTNSQPGGGLMQVSATLQPDDNNFSGYKWSASSGPEIKISPGTTTTVRVKLEERKPISYVIPILRSVSGIY